LGRETARSLDDSTIKEEFMRKYALLAALAGAIFTTAVALPNRADAMTFSTPSGVLDAAATIDVAQPERVRWCGWRGCWGGYWGPRPYYYGYYRPYAYYPYGYYPAYYGWGYRRWWW
jgi:hypothetical protein